MAAFAAGGYLTVGEGIVYPFMLDLFATACAREGVVAHYAVLWAPIAVVQQRVQDRRLEPQHAGALADAAVVGDMWAQFGQLGVAARHRVDVDGLSADGVAEEIDRRFVAGEFLLEKLEGS